MFIYKYNTGMIKELKGLNKHKRGRMQCKGNRIVGNNKG